MILIDSSFWGNVGVASNDGNAAGNQYDFYNYIDMANGEVVTNQYQFFKESAVDGVYYNTPDDWYEAVGTLYSEPIIDEYSFYQNVTFDGVNPVGNQYEFFKFLTDAISGAFNLSSALHEWNYQNATDVGTTVTMPDTGSIGGLPMANPDAASKPTLTADYLETDGISQYLINEVSDFRFGDNTGVAHLVVKAENGILNVPFITADNSTENFYILFYLGTTLQPTINARDGGSTQTLKSSTTVTDGDYVVITWFCNGSDNYLLINGVLVGGYDVDNFGSQWFNDFTGRDNISIGSLQKLTPIYYTTKMKYVSYCPYVDLATVQNEALEIKAALI